MAQIDKATSQQTQRPVREAGWRLAAGHGDQLGLLLACEFVLVLPVGFARTQGELDAILDEGLTGAVDRGQTDIQDMVNLLICPSRTVLRGIGLEEDAGAGNASHCRFPFLGQRLQALTLLVGKSHPVFLLVHRLPSWLLLLPPFNIQMPANYSIHDGQN